jgi:mRNA interferase MazF
LVAPVYIPDRGDIVFLNFDPTKGHEQRGHRPVLVLSPISYNRKTSLALFMSITSKQKGYPFEVVLSEELKTQGVVLADRIKCLDWKDWSIEFVEVAPKSLIEVVQAKIAPLLF